MDGLRKTYQTDPYNGLFTARKTAGKIRLAAIMVSSILLLPSLLLPSYGQYQPQDCSAPLTVNIGPNYNGPVVIDAYWVDQPSFDSNATSYPPQKEIGPGEGVAVFAVILNNKGSNTLSSITAFLNLPQGFAPTGKSRIPQLLQTYNPASKVASNYAVASYYGFVPPGGTFVLYFDVDVLKAAKVRTYDTTLVVNYEIGVGAASTVQSCTSALLQVPLLLPGKVVMDIISDRNIIPPGKPSPITITLANKGSANATGVVATIVNLGVTRGGTNGATAGSVVLQSAQTNIVNLGSQTFDLGTIPANGSAQIHTTVFPSSSAGGTTQDVQLQVNYQNAWGRLLTDTLDTGLVVSPTPPQSLTLSYLGNTTSPVIVSGNLDDLNFAVSNIGTTNASTIVVSLVPQSASVSVVGQSTWTIPRLGPGETQNMSTQVFAANSMINTPTSFTLTANYVANGQSQTNSLTLGAFVIGDIRPEIYGLTVNTVGNSPQISGNLLNQGSTTGLFTTIELTKSPLLDAIREAHAANQSAAGGGSAVPASNNQGSAAVPARQQAAGNPTQQFLGDLTADSPIPFTMPIAGLSHVPPGVYEASFKVVYADDLKKFHTVVLTENMVVPRAAPARLQEITPWHTLTETPVLAALAALAAATAIIAYVIRKRSRHKMLMLTGRTADIAKIFEREGKEKNESQ